MVLEIELSMNAWTGHTVDINLSTESIHCDNPGRILRGIQNLQIRLVKKSWLESLERQTRKKTLHILWNPSNALVLLIMISKQKKSYVVTIEPALWSEGFIVSINSTVLSSIQNQLDAWRARVTVALVRRHPMEGCRYRCLNGGAMDLLVSVFICKSLLTLSVAVRRILDGTTWGWGHKQGEKKGDNHSKGTGNSLGERW